MEDELIINTVVCRLLDTVLQSARSHGPIRFMLTSLPANLIGSCDLGGCTSVKQLEIYCNGFSEICKIRSHVRERSNQDYLTCHAHDVFEGGALVSSLSDGEFLA